MIYIITYIIFRITYMYILYLHKGIIFHNQKVDIECSAQDLNNKQMRKSNDLKVFRNK